MVTLIILSDDLAEVEVFKQGKEENVLPILKDWTIKATDAEGVEADEIWNMSFKSLDGYADGYYWGENDAKRVHVLSTTKDRMEGWRTVV